MSRHRFVVEIELGDDALSGDENAARSAQGPIVPVDPSEWEYSDLAFAASRWWAKAEIVDYDAVLTPAEQAAVAAEASRARAEGSS